MWYIESSNGGCYTHIKNEYPAEEVMSNLIDTLKSNGIKFYVHYWQYEYNGYSSNVFLMNDETLEEIYVFHDIAWEHSGTAFWYIEAQINSDYVDTLVYDSRYGVIADYIASKWNTVLKISNTLCLPLITPEMEMHRELDILHRKAFNKPAKTFKEYKKNFPHSYASLIEMDLIVTKKVLNTVKQDAWWESDDVIVL